MSKAISTYAQWCAVHDARAVCPYGCKPSTPLVFSTDEIVPARQFDAGLVYCGECLGEMVPVRKAAA
jgi:hypothetical protein